MYIGRYDSFFTNNYSSFATVGYKRLSSGIGGEWLYQYCGQTGANRIVKCKEGRGKTDAAARAAARAHFCATYGKNGRCYGDDSTKIPDSVKASVPYSTLLENNPKRLVSPKTQSNVSNPAHYKPSSNRLPSVGGTSGSDSCGGCNVGDIKCEIGKFSCEFTNEMKNWWNGMGESFGKGFSEFGMLPMMALGLGGLIVIAIIMKR